MAETRNLLGRIAKSLEQIARSPHQPTDWLRHAAYYSDGETGQGVSRLNSHPIELLRGIEEQKARVLENFERHANGAAAHDILLWGARGMGKSALIKAAFANTETSLPGKIALIQMAPGSLSRFPNLAEQLAGLERRFIVFIDDLGFESSTSADNLALRSMLDGGIVERPQNIRLAVTTNRRNIVPRNQDDQSAQHERDERDNSLALADRFGLSLGFHPCDQTVFLEIVEAYLKPLELAFDSDEAAAWAIAKGNRSGRTAYQFACEIAGRAGRQL